MVRAARARLQHLLLERRPDTFQAVSAEIFWFKSPGLLLHPLKLALFLCSFQFCWPLFLLWQFGASSCFFTDIGFQKASAVVPYYVRV